MNNKNIFEKNAKIPDVVQQKANAAFRTIYTRQDEPDEKSQKTYKSPRAMIIKIASTVVVAAITVAVLFVAIAYFGGKESEIGIPFSNPFTIKVCAAELDPKTPLPISMDVSHQTYGCGVDWTGCAEFQINLPISVEGEKISTVTFKADNAVIEVVSIDCPSIVKSGSTKTLHDYRSTYVDGYDMAGQPIGKTEVGYYDSFSADYDTLQKSKYILNICNVLTDRMDLYYLLSYLESDDDRCAAYTYLIKDVRVTVEVTFSDGTTASRSLCLFADQFLATDKMADGTEYTYNAVQIFCYDENNIDDTTKQLISSQITRATEFYKVQEAIHPISPDTTTDETGDETVDETEASVSIETTVSTETTASQETSAGTETTVSTESSAGTDPTVSTEESKSTEEASSAENPDNVSSDDHVGTSEDI